MYEDIVRRLRKMIKAHKEIYGGSTEESVTIEQAADAIEELSSAGSIYGKAWTLGYDAGRDENMPRWIPVTERLPNVDETKDKYESVTVIASSRGWKKSRPMIYERACVRGKTVYRWKYIWDRIYDGIPVTHWMPLPSTEGLDET